MRTLILAAGLALAASSALAQGQCGPTAAVREWLAQTYGEAPVYRLMTGPTPTGPALVSELWVNPETLTWTFLQSTPDGQSCFPASGTGLESIPFVAPVQGDPT